MLMRVAGDVSRAKCSATAVPVKPPPITAITGGGVSSRLSLIPCMPRALQTSEEKVSFCEQKETKKLE
jgi:hypothetical protein